MKKYFNYIGTHTNKGKYHIVQDRNVTTYQKDSLFRAAEIVHVQPISRETRFSRIIADSDGKGCCEISTGSISEQFCIANGIEDFVNDVRREMGAPPVTLKCFPEFNNDF